MNKKKFIKILLITLVLCLLVVLVVGGYLFNMPQRDVQATETDYSLTSSQIVNEYLADSESANAKYLQEEGDSKILSVKGTFASIDKDQNNQVVILLKESPDMAGVSCTFTKLTNVHTSALKLGEVIIVKGVIRSGAGYDDDLGLYEDVIMEKCDLVM